MRKTIFWLILAGVSVIAGLLFSLAEQKKPIKTKNLDIFFAAQLTDPYGKNYPLSQYRNQPLLINFWAPWCRPCIDEMPDLAQLDQLFRAKGIHFIGIGLDQRTNILAFLKKIEVHYLILTAPDGFALAAALGNLSGGIPYTVLIDKQGKIRYSYTGQIRFAQLKEHLDQL